MEKQRTLGEFLATLPWTDPADWIGNTGYVRLDDDRRACIQAIHGPPNTSDKFYGIRVTIVHRHRGTIVYGDVLFADHLDNTARADSRTDYRGDFHIWFCTRSGYGWYIAVPADASPLTDTVHRFIETFR